MSVLEKASAERNLKFRCVGLLVGFQRTRMDPNPQHLTSSQDFHVRLVLHRPPPFLLDDDADGVREGGVLVCIILSYVGVGFFVLNVPDSHGG